MFTSNRKSLWIATVVGLSAALFAQDAAALVIDTFESTQSGNNEFLSDPPGTPAGAPTSLSETGLSGVVGGAATVRETTVASDGPGSVTAVIAPAPTKKVSFSAGGATGTLNINYSAFDEDFTGLVDVTIPLGNVELTGALTPIDLWVTLSDGLKQAAAMTQITVEGDSTHVVAAGDFTLLDGLGALNLANIIEINFLFDVMAAGQEFDVLSPVVANQASTPEPGSFVLAGIAMVAVIFLARRRTGNPTRNFARVGDAFSRRASRTASNVL